MNVLDLIGKQFILAKNADKPDPAIYRITGDPNLEEGNLELYKGGTSEWGDIPGVKWDVMIVKLKSETWYFVATDKQVEWLLYLRDFKWDLRQSTREMIQRIMSRHVPYYTMADRENLNFLRENSQS